MSYIYGAPILDVSRSHTTTQHSREDSSGRVISSPQRPLPDNTQHSQQTSVRPVEFEPTISAGELPQNYALDRAATGTGIYIYVCVCVCVRVCVSQNDNISPIELQRNTVPIDILSTGFSFYRRISPHPKRKVYR